MSIKEELKKLAAKYQLTESQASDVYGLGRTADESVMYNGHQFSSGSRSTYENNEYTIPVFGPDGVLFYYYHYDG